MELKAGGNGESALAIVMLAATGTLDALQPGAFARIILWSHGHASVDTGKCSEWGNTDDPVFIPMSAQDEWDAAIELEVSLWEEVTGESGDVSRMFDAVAEVSLPPPKDLGTSEHHSIERTFPLEGNGVQAGTLTLRAWIITPKPEEAKHSSSAYYCKDAEVPPRDAPDNRWRSDDDFDDTLYELSESSGNTSAPKRVVSGTLHNQGSTSSRPLASEASATLLAHKLGEGVLPHVREPLQKVSSSTRCIRDARNSRDGPSPGCYAQSRRTNIQQTATENAAITVANASHHTLPPSSVPSADGAATTAARSVDKAAPPDFPDRDVKQFRHDLAGGPPLQGCNAAATDMVDRGIDPPLDISASLLALTPSYPPGHAEVRLWVHGILVGRDLILETRPYVRASLYSIPSRVHSIARTGPLHGPISTHAMFQANGRTHEGSSLTTPPANTVEYLPKGENAGRHVSLSLGSADKPLVWEGGFPPVLRLEIVWGRSLGRCDLSLVEALRQPGITFKHIEAPIRKEEPKGQSNCQNRKSTDGSPAGNGAQETEAIFDGTRRFTAGQVRFDVGVRLTGKGESSPPAVNTSTERTMSFVKVEAIGLRVAAVRGGDSGSAVEQRDRIIGVSAKLALGDELKLATIDPRHLDVSGKDGGLVSVARVDSQHCSAVLSSTCTELDVLVLRLERRPRTPHLGEGSTSRDPRNRDGPGGKEHALSIPVSDINGCFCRRAQWVAIDCFGEECSSTRNVGNQNDVSGQAGSREHHLEIQLRVTVTLANPTNQCTLGASASEDGQLVEGPVPRPGTCCFTGPSFDQNLLFGAINSNASWSAFQAWVLSPRNACGQSHAISSSIGSTESPPRTGRTFSTLNGVRGSDSPGQGPGVLQLEILAMHEQAADLAEKDTRGWVSETHLHLWWVRVTVSDGKGSNVTVDSSLGEVHEGAWHAGQSTAGSRAKCGGVVRWPVGKRARARSLMHWTPKKRVLPTASLSIFRGKILTAESTLELAPVITSPGRVLTFLHPCIPTPMRDGSPFTRSEFFLELRGMFAGSSGGYGSDEGYGSYSQRLAPGLRVARPAQSGGVLCIQVLAVRRLHRAVRSTLALPFLVVFSLPPDMGSCCATTSRPPPPADENGRRGQPHFRIAGDESRDVASLRIESCRLGSVTVLVSLFGGFASNTSGGDLPSGQDNATDHLRLLGSTWLAISDDVMKRGHLHGGWHPLRIGGSSAGEKACEMRLGVHFMPDFPSAAGTAKQLPAWGTDDANFVSIFLEEGRELSHPDMPVGPLDLFVEVSVHYQPRGGERRSWAAGEPTRNVPGSASHRSERMVGPLPLREAPAHAAANGACSSPCWRHLLRVPLPPALLCILRSASSGNRTDGSASATAVLHVEVKSASRRTVDRSSSPVACSSCSIAPGLVPVQGERVVERCLRIGVARLRLPSYILRHEHGRKYSPIRGWYVVKEENSGHHRGKVKLSVLPPNWSAHVRPLDKDGDRDNNSNRRGLFGGDPSDPQRYCSVSSAKPAKIRHRRTSAAGNTNVEIDGGHSDSSVQSEDTEKAVRAMLRQAGGARQGGQEESGLLLVSVSCPTIRSPGKDRTPDDHASLLGATVSLQCGQDYNVPAPVDPPLCPPRDEGRPSPLWTDPTKILGNTSVKGGVPSSNSENNHKGDSKSTSDCSSGQFRLFSATGAEKCSTEVCMQACVQSESDGCASAHESRSGEYTAVLSVKERELRGHSVLYMQVRVKAPPRSHTTYHGVADLAPCFSSLGLETQEKIYLMKEKVDPRVQRYASSTLGAAALSRGGRGQSCEEGREGCAREVTTLCTVNVTTTYVPHTSGVLEVNPSELRLTPPSTEDINRWCAYTDLRKATEPRANIARAPRAARDGDLACTTRCVFLRVRVLPSGPWAFTRTFQANWPRPMEWARDSSNAGLTRIPAWAPVALDVDTSIHTARRSSTSSTGAADVSAGGEFEALMLEVCLFDNLPSSPSCLLGRGTLPLTPSITAGYPQNHYGQGTANSSPASKHNVSSALANKELALIEPVSGIKTASVALCVRFLHGAGATSGTAPHLRVLADGDGGVSGHGGQRPREVQTSVMAREVSAFDASASAAAWLLKAIFYHLDHRNTGAVRLDELLDSVANTKWPWGESRVCYADGNIDPTEGQVDERVVVLGRSKALRARGRHRLSDHSTRVEVDDGKRWVRRLLEPLVFKEDGVVSWEVWAALCDVLCRAAEAGQITPASVWKRAVELQSGTLCSSNCCFNSRTGRGNGGYASQGQTGCRYFTNEKNDGFDELANGYDVVMLVADDRPLENPACDHQAPIGGEIVRVTSPCDRPTMTRRRLHRTLATSQRVWPKERQPQPHLGQTNQVKSFSSRKASVVVSPPRKSSYAFRSGVNESNPRPSTEPPRCPSNTNAPSSSPARPASAKHRLPTVNRDVVMESDPPSSGREPPSRVAAWGVATEEERCKTAREVETQRLELDNSRKETSSAKHKASRYKTYMLEAQSFLDDERRRILALEERALGLERQLLQRDRVRILEAARARTHFLELEMSRTRRSDRLTAKRIRERAEVEAATTLQLRAKGFVQRVRYKAQLLSIVALQRMVRFRREARSHRRHRARRLSATLLLQSLWRGRLTRKVLEARAMLTTKAQALVRGALQRARIRDALQAHLRRRSEAAVLLQKNRRQVVARRAFLVLRIASVKIQMHYCRRRATKVIQRAARIYLFNSSREKAANLLQISYRLSARTKKARRERRKILAAAGALQRVARGWAARRAVREVLETRRRNDAAATVQRSLGRYLATQKIRCRRVAAALTICEAVVVFSAKLSRLKLSRDTAAVTAIQSLYRGYTSRMTTGARLLIAERNEAAIKVQSLFRTRNQREPVAFIVRRTQRGNDALANEQALPNTRSTSENLPLVTSSEVVTPAVRPEGREHATSSAKFEEEAGESRVARAPVTHGNPSSGSGDYIGGKRDDDIDSGLSRVSLTKSRLLVAEMRETALEVNKNAPPVTAVTAGENRAARRRYRKHEALQLAVQAVARGMARRGVITPDDARGLQHTLSLGEDDPALAAALQRRLSGLQAATVRSKAGDINSSGRQGGYKVSDAAVGLGGSDDDALRRALTILDRRFPLPLE